MAFPKIGNLARVFSLQNFRGETVSLKDFKGKKHGPGGKGKGKKGDD